MSKKFILDPLWLTKGSFLDPEYFNYILLDASSKYKTQLRKGNIDNFDELLYHILNLNNLTVNGEVLSPKFKKVSNNPRLSEIKKSLKKTYSPNTEGVMEIFKNANYVFLNLLLDYMSIQLDTLDEINIFYKNEFIHQQDDIFIITHKEGSDKCTVWRMKMDTSKNFGYSFSKSYTIHPSEIKDKDIITELKKINGETISSLLNKKNMMFVVIDQEKNETLIAKVIKDVVFLNKKITKDLEFEPMVISELYHILWSEKVLPFTLEEWVPI